MRVSIGYGGWVAVDGLGLPGPLYVRMRDVEGRLRVVEFYIDASDSDGIAGRDLRELPLQRVEGLISTHAEEVRGRMDVASPDLSTLATYYATSFGSTARQIAAGNWVVASFASQHLPPDTDSGEIEGHTTDGKLRVMRVKRGRRRPWKDVRKEHEFRLTSGPTEGLTEEFLRDVARAYAAAVTRGEKPNVAIADQTGHPPRTVQRWVYLARKAKIMPRGQQGRAGF